DAIGDVRAWRIPIDGPRPGLLETFRLGTTVDPDSVSVSADGSLVAFSAAHGDLVVRALAEDAGAVHLRVGPAETRITTRLASDGRTLVTADGARIRVWDAAPRGTEQAATAPRGTEQAADPDVTALAMDSGGAVTALGFRG